MSDTQKQAFAQWERDMEKLVDRFRQFSPGVTSAQWTFNDGAKLTIKVPKKRVRPKELPDE